MSPVAVRVDDGGPVLTIRVPGQQVAMAGAFALFAIVVFPWFVLRSADGRFPFGTVALLASSAAFGAFALGAQLEPRVRADAAGITVRRGRHLRGHRTAWADVERIDVRPARWFRQERGLLWVVRRDGSQVGATVFEVQLPDADRELVEVARLIAGFPTRFGGPPIPVGASS